jgi:hypothetical protein
MVCQWRASVRVRVLSRTHTHTHTLNTISLKPMRARIVLKSALVWVNHSTVLEMLAYLRVCVRVRVCVCVRGECMAVSVCARVG